MPACAAYGCVQRSKTGDISLHKFPTNVAQRQKWIIAVNRANFNPSHCAVLCSKHFTEEDFNRIGQRLRLHSNAIPSVFPPIPARLRRDLLPVKHDVDTVSQVQLSLVTSNSKSLTEVEYLPVSQIISSTEKTLPVKVNAGLDIDFASQRIRSVSDSNSGASASKIKIETERRPASSAFSAFIVHLPRQEVMQETRIGCSKAKIYSVGAPLRASTSEIVKVKTKCDEYIDTQRNISNRGAWDSNGKPLDPEEKLLMDMITSQLAVQHGAASVLSVVNSSGVTNLRTLMVKDTFDIGFSAGMNCEPMTPLKHLNVAPHVLVNMEMKCASGIDASGEELTIRSLLDKREKFLKTDHSYCKPIKSWRRGVSQEELERRKKFKVLQQTKRRLMQRFMKKAQLKEDNSALIYKEIRDESMSDSELNLDLQYNQDLTSISSPEDDVRDINIDNSVVIVTQIKKESIADTESNPDLEDSALTDSQIKHELTSDSELNPDLYNSAAFDKLIKQELNSDSDSNPDLNNSPLIYQQIKKELVSGSESDPDECEN